MGLFDHMFLVSKEEYHTLKSRSAIASSIEGVGGDAHESQINNIEVTGGGTLVIGDKDGGQRGNWLKKGDEAPTAAESVQESGKRIKRAIRSGEDIQDGNIETEAGSRRKKLLRLLAGARGSRADSSDDGGGDDRPKKGTKGKSKDETSPQIKKNKDDSSEPMEVDPPERQAPAERMDVDKPQRTSGKGKQFTKANALGLAAKSARLFSAKKQPTSVRMEVDSNLRREAIVNSANKVASERIKEAAAVPSPSAKSAPKQTLVERQQEREALQTSQQVIPPSKTLPSRKRKQNVLDDLVENRISQLTGKRLARTEEQKRVDRQLMHDIREAQKQTNITAAAKRFIGPHGVTTSRESRIVPTTTSTAKRSLAEVDDVLPTSSSSKQMRRGGVKRTFVNDVLGGRPEKALKRSGVKRTFNNDDAAYDEGLQAIKRFTKFGDIHMDIPASTVHKRGRAGEEGLAFGPTRKRGRRGPSPPLRRSVYKRPMDIDDIDDRGYEPSQAKRVNIASRKRKRSESFSDSEDMKQELDRLLSNGRKRKKFKVEESSDESE